MRQFLSGLISTRPLFKRSIRYVACALALIEEVGHVSKQAGALDPFRLLSPVVGANLRPAAAHPPPAGPSAFREPKIPLGI